MRRTRHAAGPQARPGKRPPAATGQRPTPNSQRPSANGRRLTAALLCIGAAACNRGPVSVEVLATFPDSVPLAGVTITAFPYDPQRLLDSLASLYPVPKPDFSALEAELRAFRPPEIPTDDPAVRAAAATRDSVRRLADSLRAADRRAPGYATAYARFRQLYARLTDRSNARQRALAGSLDGVRSLADRAGRAADSLRSWEESAYAEFDSAAALEVSRRGQEPVAAVTDNRGWARLALRSGTWHLVARMAAGDNPFVDRVWDVPVTVAGFPLRTALMPASARIHWRH